MSGARFHNVDDLLAFALAGRARLTLVSLKSGQRFTYRIAQAVDRLPDGREQAKALWFVALMNGPDNERSFAYLGTIKPEGGAGFAFYHGRKSRISREAPSARAFSWAWSHVMRGSMPPQAEVWHEGQCGRCGRALTVPTSIASGIGPECAARLGLGEVA